MSNLDFFGGLESARVGAVQQSQLDENDTILAGADVSHSKEEMVTSTQKSKVSSPAPSGSHLAAQSGSRAQMYSPVVSSGIQAKSSLVALSGSEVQKPEMCTPIPSGSGTQKVSNPSVS